MPLLDSDSSREMTGSKEEKWGRNKSPQTDLKLGRGSSSLASLPLSYRSTSSFYSHKLMMRCIFEEFICKNRIKANLKLLIFPKKFDL